MKFLDEYIYFFIYYRSFTILSMKRKIFILYWYMIYILHQCYIYVFSIHKVFSSLLQTLEIVVMFCYIWSVAKILRQTKCLRVEKKVRWFTTKSFFRIFSSGSNTWHLVRDNPVCNILSKKQIKTSFIFYNILWR